MIKRGFFIAACVCMLFAPLYAQENGTKEKAREYYLRGNIFYQQGKYKEAEAEFQKALEVLGTGQVVAVGVKSAPGAAAAAVAGPVTDGPGRILEYSVGPDDILQVSVWQNPDLTQEAIVRPDGKISFPLIGDIQAAGLSITALDEEITQRLKEYIKYPEVSIAMKKLGGQKVIVLGEVAHPGVYAVSGAQSILEAIGQAGGFTKDAVASSVVLIRGGFTHARAERLNLNKALAGDQRINARVQAEDVVFVPKKFIANVNYFLSQILDPLSKGMYTAEQLQGF